jgi:hypothetical protein
MRRYKLDPPGRSDRRFLKIGKNANNDAAANNRFYIILSLIALACIIVAIVLFGVYVPLMNRNFQHIYKISSGGNGSSITSALNVGTLGTGILKNFTETGIIIMKNIIGIGAVVVSEDINGDIEIDLENVEHSQQNNVTGNVTYMPKLTIDTKGIVIDTGAERIARILSINGIEPDASGELSIIPVIENTVVNQNSNGIQIDTAVNLVIPELTVSGQMTLNTNVRCLGGSMDTSCFDLSMETCSSPISASCIPENASFACLSVYNFTANESNIHISNQTALQITNLTVTNTMQMNGPIICESEAIIDSSCYQHSCPSAPLSQSCFSDIQTYVNLTFTDTLNVNDVTCATNSISGSCFDLTGHTCNSPIGMSCISSRIASINNATPVIGSDYDITIVGDFGMSVVNLDISTTSERNTASSVGSTGEEVFKQKTGSVLEFKNIASGAEIFSEITNNNAIVMNLNDTDLLPGTFENVALTIDVYGRTISAVSQPSGSTITASNEGNLGVGTIKQLVSDNMEIRSIDGSSGVLQVTESVPNNVINIEMPDTVVTPGTYGDFNNSVQMDVTEKGRITAITTAPIVQKAGSVIVSIRGKPGLNQHSGFSIHELYINTCGGCFSGNTFTAPRAGLYHIYYSGRSWDYSMGTLTSRCGSLGTIAYRNGDKRYVACRLQVGDRINYSHSFGKTVSGFNYWTIFSLF